MSSTEVHRVSQSDVNHKKSCPQCWSWEKEGLIGLPMDKQDAEFGLAVHSAIAEFYTHIAERPKPADIESIARRVFADKVLSEFPTLSKRCESQLQNFIRFELTRLKTWKQYKPTFAERKLSDGYIVGVVDAYWEQDGICLDWKTGGNGDLTDAMIIQGAFYRALLEYSGYPVKRIMFFMLSTGYPKDAPITAKAYLEQLILSFKNCKISPVKGIHCNWCGYTIRCAFKDYDMWDLV